MDFKQIEFDENISINTEKEFEWLGNGHYSTAWKIYLIPGGGGRRINAGCNKGS